MLICHTPCDPLCPTSAEGASGFCQTMPPSDRQLMSIGASEHRAFVRAKARFAGPKGSGTHFVHRNAVIPDILPCIVGGIFWRKVPRVLCPSRSPSVRPARSHSLPVERHLPGPLRHPPLPGVSRVTRHPARHYGSGRTGTGSLLRCFCVEQEAARSRCAFKTGNQLCENSEIQSC